MTTGQDEGPDDDAVPGSGPAEHVGEGVTAGQGGRYAVLAARPAAEGGVVRGLVFVAIVCAMPSLLEDLVILAVGARPRGGPGNGKLPMRLRYGMRGAVLVALALAGRVEVADGQVIVQDPAPLGDPDLDEALAGLAASRAVPVADWMAGSPAGFVSACFERLEAEGVLRSETVWLLFIAKRKGYRLVDPGYFEKLRAALRAAVTGAGLPRPRERVLARQARGTRGPGPGHDGTRHPVRYQLPRRSVLACGGGRCP